MIDALQAPIDRLDAEVREHAKAYAGVNVLTRLPHVGALTALVIWPRSETSAGSVRPAIWPPGPALRPGAARTSPSGIRMGA